jgi:hypothetical protein
MIERARRPLQDCRFALQKFECEPVLEEFRMTLVLCLTLLRAVGHVLVSEAKEKPALKIAVDATWPSKKRDPIFSAFIEVFRNKVVKEYRASVKWASITPYDGPHRMEYKISDGAYEDQDVRDVLNNYRLMPVGSCSLR